MTPIESIELLFAPIAAAVEQFAANHAFKLAKCERGNNGWELSQPHREGGEQTLLLLYDPALGLGVGAVWSVPCAETRMLYSHFCGMNACPIEPETVVAALEAVVGQLAAVRYGHWTHMQPFTP
jgi:hypothetical protein